MNFKKITSSIFQLFNTRNWSMTVSPSILHHKFPRVHIVRSCNFLALLKLSCKHVVEILWKKLNSVVYTRGFRISGNLWFPTILLDSTEVQMTSDKSKTLALILILFQDTLLKRFVLISVLERRTILFLLESFKTLRSKESCYWK